MPNHEHVAAGAEASGDTGTQFPPWTGRFTEWITEEAATKRYYALGVFSAGNNHPHNNMPPYLCVNMWIRKE